MISALMEWDLWLVRQAVQLTNQGGLLHLLVYISAELLIFIYPLVLFILWQQPEIRSNRHGVQKAVILAMLGVVLALAIKSFFNFVWERPRPFIVDQQLLVIPFRGDSLSFPSGHALVAFTIAGSLLWSGYKKLGRWLLLVAGLIALGRVLAGVHYPSDILAGALLGILVGWYLHREASSLRCYLPDH